ncbi:hypothetical protein [Streptomyces sp. NBC_01803]|uniref:hypothetical protein n=1 Tax=Streptomyces sp. NBC_01803 TaxID=2975946 RepID=UPI002DDAF33A|nr:hypothetical protein [Streptomyces sp. NBC_01803]WSA44489.1 hypothetical protein OIE51_09895 [Streptomyces sp. NBC_01803]
MVDSRFIGLPHEPGPFEARQYRDGWWYVITPDGGIAHDTRPDGTPQAARDMTETDAQALAAKLNERFGLQS